SIELSVGRAIFDRHVFALGEANVFEALAKPAHPVRDRVRRCGVEEPDHRQRRLLRTRPPDLDRKQQTARTEQCNELTPVWVEHGDFLPYALLAPPTGPCAQSSTASACRRAARKSLGQT